MKCEASCSSAIATNDNGDDSRTDIDNRPPGVKMECLVDDSDDESEDEDDKFQTVQEKMDSWQSESDGLKMGLLRLDPPRPFGSFLLVSR